MIARGCLLAVFLSASLYPQVLERSRIELPEDERKAIEEARRGAKPRPFTARKTSLSEAEKERIRAFETVKNSVVQINAPSTGADTRNGMPSPAQLLGAGVIWDESGHIVTNYHVVSGISAPTNEAKRLMVKVANGSEYHAVIVGVVPENDLALLKIENKVKEFVPIPLGRSSDLVVGQSVLALGNPFFKYSLTSGIVSALDRVIPSPVNTPITGVIQTDTAINPGNSGGPLLNHKGQMVGLNAALLSPSGSSAGLNYAIPSDTVIKIIAGMLGNSREAGVPPPLNNEDSDRANAFNNAKHSVVSIHTKERYHNFWTGSVMVDPVGSGSGVLWDSSGYVVTNFHVIAIRDQMLGTLKVADIITVTTDEDTEIEASLVGEFQDIDIAVLKLKHVTENLKPISIGTTSDLKVGQSVMALGNPFGIGQSLTSGIISALGRTIDSPNDKSIKGVIQTDVAINPGNSGGPLLDMNGRLLGINTMIISSTGANANVGFAVPVDLISKEIKFLTDVSQKQPSSAPSPSREDKMRADIFNKAKDSVVFVHAITDKEFYDHWTGNIFRLPPASGTGLVWDDRGHIVTSYSTVFMQQPLTDQLSEAENLRVTLADGNTYRARIIGRSLEYDVAVLRVFAPFKDMHPLPLARLSDLKVGQSLFALGNPFGMDHSLSAGILSAEQDLNSSIRGAIQTDAAINPGNIGGPILDSDGRLAGMGFYIAGANSNSGINFAISSTTLNRIVPILLAKGQVERPALGFVSVSAPDAIRFFNVKKGILINYVEPDTPAYRAGLRGLQQSKTGMEAEIGDVIIGLSGKTVESNEALWDLIEQEPPGALLSFDVLRNGKRIKVVVKPNG